MNVTGQHPLRIAFFLHDLRGGGVERVSVHLANEMCSLGHHVELVLVNREGNQAYFDAIRPEVRICELRQSRTLFSAFGFRSYIRRSKPHLIVSALTHINVAALLATSSLRDKPHVIVVEHNHQVGRMFRGGMNGLSYSLRLAFHLVPFLYCRADTIAAVSEGVRRDLSEAAKIPESEISLLCNPVTVGEVSDLPQASGGLRWHADRNSPYILGIGSLSYEKNFGALIEAFALVRSKRDVRLIIAGEGPERGKLEAAAESIGFADDILFPGYVSDPFQLMRDAAVLALTSRWEGLPTVLIEAMALGTSVVATDCQSGPAEILLDGAIGRLVPTDDINALASALSDTLDTPQEISLLKKRASDFEPAIAAQRYLDAYGSRHQGVGLKTASAAVT